MTTWYVDCENGTDANASAGNGDSFATRRKYSSNITASVLAPGDTIKFIGTPAPYSLGSASWVGQSQTTTSRTITSSTNTTPIVITAAAAHDLATGDYIALTGHSTNTAANGFWQVTVLTSTTFSLNGSIPNGAGQAGLFDKTIMR